MTYLANRDYNLEVLRGNVAGHAMVAIIGHDEDLTTTRTTIHPSGTTLNIDQSGIAASAATVDVASTDADDTSAGAGVRTVSLIGLDSSGDIQSETIIMNGQTEVTSSNTYTAVNGLLALTWGATTWNEGTLWVGNGTFTAGVPATKYFAANPVFNKGLTAYYVVPTGKTLFMRFLALTLSTASRDVDFFIEHSTNGINWITDTVFGLEPGDFQDRMVAIPGIVAGSHIRIEGVASASASDTTVILSCELVDN